VTAGATTWQEEARQHAYAAHLKQLGPRYLADGRRRVVWLDTWARRQRFVDETPPRDAQGFVRLGFRCLDLGDEEGAWKALEQGLLLDPGTIDIIRARGRDLQAQGFSGSAASLIQRFATSVL